MNNIKQILLIFMSVYIVILSVYNSSFVSYASYVTDVKPNHLLKAVYESSDDRAKREEAVSEILDALIAGGSFAASSLGAIVQGEDFTQFIKNYESYRKYVLDGTLQDNVTVSDDYSVSISADLMSVIKDALREYSEETNGFWLIPTTSIRALNPTDFYDKQAYITLQNLINNHGIIACQVEGALPPWGNGHVSFIAADFSDYICSGYNLVCWNSGYDPYNATGSAFIGIYNGNWEKVNIEKKYQFNHTIYNNVSDGSLFARGGYSWFFADYPKYNDGDLYNCADTVNTNAQTYGMLISKDGCRIRVFKSVNAMKVYSLGERTVYFGTDFYEKEPTEITIKVDEFDKYLDTDFDKYFGQLKDTIISQGSNLSEQDIEKLTDSILGKLTDIDNNIGHVGDAVQESNNLLSQILSKLDNLDKNVSNILTSLDNKVSSTLEFDFSGIEDRLDTIIASLGIISGQLDDMTAEEIEQRTDDMLNEMQLEFSDIGEVAKTKFPLSLPWDLGKAFDKISGGDITSGESPPEAVAMLLYDEPDKFVHTMSLYDDNGISLYALEDTDSSQGGGYFPSMEFSTDSLRGTDNGGHISSGGHEHGGGGASRWGAWHSDTGAPIFYIPVEFSQSMKIGGMLIIDLSGFEVLHSIGRLMFSVIFCMNLVHLTFKAISAGKDVLTW